MVPGELGLVLGYAAARPVLHDQALRVHHPDAILGLGLARPLVLHRHEAEPGDAQGRLTVDPQSSRYYLQPHPTPRRYRPNAPATHLPGTLEHYRVVRELRLGQPERGEEAGDRDRGRALDVIVEGAIMLAVLVEQPEGVRVAKVLELYEGVLAVALDRGLHELVHELVVLRAGDALVPMADVQRVLQQRLRVRKSAS
jgi:hypothetical protein